MKSTALLGWSLWAEDASLGMYSFPLEDSCRASHYVECKPSQHVDTAAFDAPGFVAYKNLAESSNHRIGISISREFVGVHEWTLSPQAWHPPPSLPQ